MSPINQLPTPPFAPLPTGNQTATPAQSPATPWINDGNLKATYENGTLLLETGERSDTIVIDQHANGCLNVNVNGTAYDFPATYTSKGKQKAIELHIKSNGGNDNISIRPYVMLKAIVESGDGNDSIHAGGGDTRLFGGRGNGILWLGSGTGYAEGNEDNDTLIGGTGNNALYGTGKGSDSVYSHNSKDLIYAKRSDKLDTAAGTNVTYEPCPIYRERTEPGNGQAIATLLHPGPKAGRCSGPQTLKQHYLPVMIGALMLYRARASQPAQGVLRHG